MSTYTTPRVTAPDLAEQNSRIVRVIARVLSTTGTEAVLEANGNLTAKLPAALEPLEENQVYEFIGKVVDDATINTNAVTHVGDDIDFDLVNRVVAAEKQYKEFF